MPPNDPVNTSKRKWKTIVFGGFYFLLIFSIWFFRYSILRGIGNFLINEDELKKSEVMFVLGGRAYERGNEAVKIFKQGYAHKIVCTSGNFPSDYLALDLPYLESDATKVNITRQGIDDGLVTAIHEGTSTFEEAEIILKYCEKNQISSCIILSSKFHTGRAKKVFEKKLKAAKIDFIIRGAPAADYDENKWWESEYGLINVNNEYIKMVYYFIKH